MSKKENPHKIQHLIDETVERIKELSAINQTTEILREGKSVSESLLKVCKLLPDAYQYPQFTEARIRFEEHEYKTSYFVKTEWCQRQRFETIDDRIGYIEVYYTKKFASMDEGPFLKEERDLIRNIAGIIEGYINSIKAKKIWRFRENSVPISFSGSSKITDKQLLRKFLNKSNYNRDVYHDLMPFKVKEILLFANLYDAFSIEKEGRFSEYVLGEYQQLNLTSLPRITGVSSEEELFYEMQNKHFDLVIFMVGVDFQTPVTLSEKIKKDFPYIPVFALLNNNTNISAIQKELNGNSFIDKLFAWNGESTVFFSMIKQIEDSINVENDTQVGMVRVILLVEDSPKYYSRYLPMLYKILMEQTRRVIDDVTTDELYKVLRLRARPKILHAKNYEEAVNIFDKYREYMLCLISDVKFDKEGEKNSGAGFHLVKYVRTINESLPIVVQSSNPDNSVEAYKYRASFINKSSDSLEQDLRSFIDYYLGFGDFVYKNKHGKKIATARSLKEFEQRLHTIPDDSLLFHSNRNHFSMWLMARGEIQAAKVLAPQKVSNFGSVKEIREYMIDVISDFREEQNKGKIIPFDEVAILNTDNVVRLADGALGGKGRGLAFINTLINNYDFSKQLPDVNIKAPVTLVIGTEEFECFMKRNNLSGKVLEEMDYEELKKLFLEAKLTERLKKRLKVVLKKMQNPVAVRSSGLFEDSLMQPFAGIFDTFLLPNNNPDFKVRYQQISDAIKLVFASVYSKMARGYIKAIDYKLEEEKMAVVIQEVVGSQYEEFFYPHISGVAQSYNYYPVSHMKPDEGFAVIGVGLGKYIVEGEKAYRFSPKYPSTEISTPKDQFKDSQTELWAVDLSKKKINLLEGDTAGLCRLSIDDAERHGVLNHTASVYDMNSHRFYPGIAKNGPRVLNFANILKNNYVPLAQTITAVLDVVQEAMGSPVEIEFAVDLNKDADWKASFYILQIKPLIGKSSSCSVSLDDIPEEKRLLHSEKMMGNGVIDDIADIVFIDRERFDKSKTEEMAEEIEIINKKMISQGKNYVLIGPGRWGSRDRWIGIPVNWPQISNAKVIVETSLENFPLESSSGSHFFHNVTSMNVGYFSVFEKENSYVKWEKLESFKVIEQPYYFKHIR
ncbi:MAG: PEP/pyruvate-binding domain-containing protein, partial [Bacteroidota bacterium]|nr:PEP/pyruvate-binding domain-containing protein [Bacteroidota bacterium]